MTSAVLITGSAKRVGAELAQAFAAWGKDVAIHYKGSKEAAEELAHTLAQTGIRCMPFQADLGDAQDTEALIANVIKEFSNLSLLINNASLFDHDEGLTFDVQQWDRQHNVNVRAPAILGRDLARLLQQKDRQGSIINILDQKVFNPMPEFFSYTASKCALERLTLLQAIEYAPQVRVNGVAPGLTLPSGAQTQEQFDKSHSKTLLGRGSTVDSIICAVKYLLDNSVVTGQVLYVDGGERLSQRRDYSELVKK